MNFAGFGKLSQFNSINRLGPCRTPKIAPGPILDARGRIVGQMRAVNLTDLNPLPPSRQLLPSARELTPRPGRGPGAGADVYAGHYDCWLAVEIMTVA